MAGSSNQSSEQKSKVWKKQEPFLEKGYKEASGIYDTQGNLQDAAQQQLDPLYNQANQAYSQKLGDFSGTDSVLDGSNLGMGTLAEMQQGGINPNLEAHYNAANSAANRNLQRNILPGIESSAQMAGQFGSSRQGIAEGIALSDANQQSTDLAANMYGQAYDADQGRRLSAGQNYIQSSLGAQGQAATQGGNSISGAGNLYNLGMDPYSRAWEPLQNYSNIIGGPAILGSGSSSGSSFNIL